MSWFLFFIDNYPHLFYLVVFVSMFIEGDVALLLLGALSKAHYAKFWYMFFVACGATLLHDFIFWRIGAYLAKYNKKKYLCFNLEKFTEKLERLSPYMGPLVFLSKFIWNFNRVVLVSAGYMGASFKKIFYYSLGSAIVWPLAYMSIGFVFAEQTELFKQRIEIAALAIAGIIGVMVLFELFIRKYIFRSIFSNTKEPSEKDKK